MQRQPLPPAAGPDTSPDSWMDAALAEHLQTQAWLENLGPMPMNLGLRGLMWLLRIYVLFMITVVGVNVAQLWR